MGDENYSVRVDGKNYSPAEISSFIIKKLIQDAQQTIGDISDVLITVPANFEDAARNATTNAGKITGVNVIGLVNEPTDKQKSIYPSDSCPHIPPVGPVTQ